MAVCQLYGVRHSEFLSWDKDDQDKAVWQHIRSLQTCPNCNTRAAEWDERVGGHRHAYLAKEARCRGCEVVEMKKASLPGDLGRGVYIELKPREAGHGIS